MIIGEGKRERRKGMNARRGKWQFARYPEKIGKGKYIRPVNSKRPTVHRQPKSISP